MSERPQSTDPEELELLCRRVAELERRLGDVERVLVGAPPPVARLDALTGRTPVEVEPAISLAAPSRVPPPLPRMHEPTVPRGAVQGPTLVPRQEWAEQERLERERGATGSEASRLAPPPLPPSTATPTQPNQSTAVVAPPAPPRSLETLIGQNWASWVGAIVLLLGVVFFLKYAWDQGWIRPSPAARVAAAVACGAVLAGAGEWLYLRRRMRALAGTLWGAGASVVIASFFAAHAYFDPPVLGPGAAFAAVVLTALLAIVAALHIGVVVVAVIGLIGAYLAPNLLGGAHDRSTFFTLYLAALAVAALGLAQLKPRWVVLRWLALASTYPWLAIWWNATGRRNGHETLALVAAVGFAALFVADAALMLARSTRARERVRDAVARNPFDVHAALAALLAIVGSMLFLLGAWGRAGEAQVNAAALALAALLAVSGVALSHLRPEWAALRWAVVAVSYAWLAMWWRGPGLERDHAALAAAWALGLYALLLVENLLTLRRFGGEMLVAARAHDHAAPPRRVTLLDTVVAASSLLSTGGALGVLLWVWGADRPVIVGAIAIILALVQGGAALVARSRDYFVSSILQSMALLTLAAPLVLDRFAVTAAWMIMASLLALAAWQLNLPKARGWAAGLLVLALVRLVAFDGRNAMLNAVQFTIFEQGVTRWLMTAWTIALLFHVLAWLRPGGGRWPALEEWIDRYVPPPPPTVARAAPSLGLRAATVLDYASQVSSAIREKTRTIDLDRAGAAFAVIGTVIFCGFSLATWHGPAATLLLALWFAGLLALASAGRRIGYGAQAWVLGMLVSARWLVLDNLVPILETWKSGGTLPAVTNLPALCGALLAGAIIAGIRMLPRGADAPASRRRRQLLIVWAGAVVFALLNFETIRFIDSTGAVLGERAIVKQVALSVLWALCGFAGVVYGFRRHVAALRWAALVLLAITLAKILVIDMAEVKAIWRILSFVAVGLLLLCVSFVYHKQTEAAN
jgi:uncharacterized membrane protein